jgi:cytosine permease
VILGLFLGLPPFVLMGAYLTAATGEEDFIRVMLLQGWGLAAIAVIALTCWAHMNATLYSASLNLAAIVRRTAKWKLTALAGLAGTVVALIGIISRYVPFLVLLSIVLPPIAGVYTADYTLRRKLYTAGRLDGLGRVHASGVLAWLAGVLIGYMTADSREMGLGLFNLTHLPAIDSYLISFVLHWGLLRAAQTIWQRNAEPVTESQ